MYVARLVQEEVYPGQGSTGCTRAGYHHQDTTTRVAGGTTRARYHSQEQETLPGPGTTRGRTRAVLPEDSSPAGGPELSFLRIPPPAEETRAVFPEDSSSRELELSLVYYAREEGAGVKPGLLRAREEKGGIPGPSRG